jgi:hypothetical protein
MQVFELVKNSLRAVNERYQDSDDLPPNIRVVVAEGGEDVTIKVRWVWVASAAGGHTARPGRMTNDVSNSTALLHPMLQQFLEPSC